MMARDSPAFARQDDVRIFEDRCAELSQGRERGVSSMLIGQAIGRN